MMHDEASEVDVQRQEGLARQQRHSGRLRVAKAVLVRRRRCSGDEGGARGGSGFAAAVKRWRERLGLGVALIPY